MGLLSFIGLNKSKPTVVPPKPPRNINVIPPGRQSKPDNEEQIYMLRESTKLVSPSFRTDLIPLIRQLYKINPDVGIALQDMFKLANTEHLIRFPNNTEAEALVMREHIRNVTRGWSKYTAGSGGLVNKMIVQCLVGGAISIEGVPKTDLSGISTVVFVNPESILFHRMNDGVYQPYQKVRGLLNQDVVKLNTETYTYLAMFNDTDEPYGVPPFMTALEPLDGQHVMKNNLKNIMEQAGLLGFLEATMTKPSKTAYESDNQYANRLTSILKTFKTNIMNGMTDGVVVGFTDDHSFKLNSTTKDLGNVESPWQMNQQSVANGLGVNGSIIGISNTNTEGGAGIMLSKLISQLRNLHMLVSFALENLYTLELRLAGFNNKGLSVEFSSTTVSDELKVQQGKEIKIRNYVNLYNQGIIDNHEFAFRMGYTKPSTLEPRAPVDVTTVPKDKKREDDKDKSDRSTRDKGKPNPTRADQDIKPR